MWWACRVVRQQRAVATAAAAALSTSANTHTRWTPDTSLVRLPANVQHCAVYRNVVSLDDEQKLYAELSYVLQQDGHVTYAATTTLPVHTSSSSSSSDEQQQQEHDDDDDDSAADDKADKDSTRNNSHTTSSHATRPVRHTYVELYGNEKPYVEARTFTRQDTRRVPGLVWSPTLMRVLRSLPLHIRQRVCSGGNAGTTTTRRDGQQRQTLSRDADAVTTTADNNSDDDAFTLDMARVVEHQLPGYEMHIEPPTVGSGFVYLNLLSDTVLEFDDEATRRHGQVYVPARALLVVAGEARWGMRFGEATTTPHIFAGRRRVEADMRLSVQAWRAHLGMLDARVLQDEVARCVAAHEARQRQKAQRASQKKTQQQHERGQGNNSNDSSSSGDRCYAKDASASAAAAAAATTTTTSSSGPLGGDLTGATVGGGATRAGVAAKPQDIARDYAAYRKQFMKAYAAMRELQSATATNGGKPVDEMQLYRKLADMTRHDDNDNDDNDTDSSEQASVCADGVNDGFDANDLEGTWERIADKAAVYKEKLRTMDYDKTAFAHSTMPPVGQREPLDMRGTLRDIAPYIKDGEKMLASLPPKPPTMPFD